MRVTKVGLAVAVVVAAASVGGACSLTSLDDLRAPDAGAADALGGDVVVVDATSDVGSPTDAGTEASLSCPSLEAGVVFCDDFDDSDASTFSRWSSVSASAGATIARADSDASAPFAARFTTSPSPEAGASPQAQLHRLFLVAPTSRVTYAFSVRILQNAPVHIALVYLRNGDPLSALDYLSVGPLSAAFSEQVYNDAGTPINLQHSLTDTLTPGKWVRVTMEWTLGDAGITALVSYDGAPVTTPIVLDPRSSFGAPQATAGIGYVTGFDDAGAQLDIDDVVVTVQ